MTKVVFLTRTIPFLLALMLLYSVNASAQTEAMRAEKKMKEIFGDSAKLETKTILLTEGMRAKIFQLAGIPYNAERVTVQLARSDDKKFYGILDNVMGKAQPITYLVVFDDSEKVKAVEVLIYRESYGGEIGYKSFRDQFSGKKYDSDLMVGSGIRNISGATISVNAITRGVKKVSSLFHLIKSQL